MPPFRQLVNGMLPRVDFPELLWLAADGFPVTDELLARLSRLQYHHINFPGRYAFTRPPAPGLRQLRDPHSDDEADEDPLSA
ncbi:hypothetical protein [Streptomyces sp. NPDC020996]|uniref:hypothetical protein n=1 Tax=Streptomyces sp. NPDC020996 TaxID=3154791 RepID=UPI0033EA7F2F